MRLGIVECAVIESRVKAELIWPALCNSTVFIWQRVELVVLENRAFLFGVLLWNLIALPLWKEPKTAWVGYIKSAIKRQDWIVWPRFRSVFQAKRSSSEGYLGFDCLFSRFNLAWWRTLRFDRKSSSDRHFLPGIALMLLSVLFFLLP